MQAGHAESCFIWQVEDLQASDHLWKITGSTIYYSQKNKVLGVITLIIRPLKSKMEELAQTKVIA